MWGSEVIEVPKGTLSTDRIDVATVPGDLTVNYFGVDGEPRQIKTKAKAYYQGDSLWILIGVRDKIVIERRFVHSIEYLGEVSTPF